MCQMGPPFYSKMQDIHDLGWWPFFASVFYETWKEISLAPRKKLFANFSGGKTKEENIMK